MKTDKFKFLSAAARKTYGSFRVQIEPFSDSEYSGIACKT